MNNYQLEQLENIRRVAETCRDDAVNKVFSRYADTYQHILDLVQTIKENDK
jgi:hypothetical protein